MPFGLIVDLLVKAIQAAPKIYEAITSAKDLTEEEKKSLRQRIDDAIAGVPEWK